MLSTHYALRPLVRSVCAVLGDAGDDLQKQRYFSHQPPALYPVLSQPKSSIARLTDEELLLIFQEAVNIVFSNPTTLEPHPKPAISVTISHVCRRWRGIALSSSYLWSHVFSCSLSEVEQHLFRSGTRPLTIYGIFPATQVHNEASSKEDYSTAIAAALVERAHRWKALRWVDGSANSATNILCLMKTPKAYPMLEKLRLTIPECVHLGRGPVNRPGTILFPALKSLSLTRVNPMVLPRSAMPSLQMLQLSGFMRKLLLSHLFSLLSETPALRMLILQLTLPTVDIHLLANNDPSSRRRPPAPRRSPLKLPELVYLSLGPAPTSGVWRLFLLLDLPVLECLILYVYTDVDTTDWLCLADGRLVPPPVRSPSAPIVHLPALHSLRVTYCISSAPTVTAPDAQPTAFPQLRHLVFPALADLQITHAFVREVEGKPTPLPLHPFDALFDAPDLTHVARLDLTGCALPFRALCDALQTRLPALEVLMLSACPGAGALVCALAPGECGGECERWRSWIGLKVRLVVLRQCEDVRAGCLRKVIEVRLRASGGGADTKADLSPSRGANGASASEPELTGTGTPPTPGPHESGAGSDSDLAEVGDRPRRIATVQVLGCVHVTEDDVRALATIPGAPTLFWMAKGSSEHIKIPAAAVPENAV
ncbi:hypothetical protein LXA43DRAFT_1185694 [Ganoderma leucocontextum]|nr:hypothetical protein LXA43DRAFT_1185694 [Ganoderma leucocontextum]